MRKLEPSPRTLCCRKASKGLAGARVASGASGVCVDLLSRRSESFLQRPGWGEFRKILVGLREFCPPAKPVIVRTSWLPPDILGECRRGPSRFVIRLNNELRQDQAIETLLHEWAHALAWNYSLDRLAGSDAWCEPRGFRPGQPRRSLGMCLLAGVAGVPRLGMKVFPSVSPRSPPRPTDAPWRAVRRHPYTG